MSDAIVLNEDDTFEKVLADMVRLSRKKRADYAAGDDPWQNFTDSAHQLDLTPGHSCELLIGVKQARLRNLLPKHWKKASQANEPGDVPLVVQNEPVEDTLIDRAVYSVIACVLWRLGRYGLSRK